MRLLLNLRLIHSKLLNLNTCVDRRPILEFTSFRFLGIKNGSSSAPWETNVLLPTDVKPVSYSLHLNPDLVSGEFSGRVSIALNITQKRDHILVHSKELNVTETELIDCRTSNSLPVKQSFEYTPNEFWVTLLEKELIPGRYILNLKFSGSLVNKIVGFYRSQYVSPDNKTRYLVTTKFEPTYARRAFPCFDEPAYKAVFNVELVRPSEGGYVALSNMQQTEEVGDSPSVGSTVVKFAPTPPMSTYLACFIVCDFEKLDTVYSQRGTQISVYARPGQSRSMLYTRDLTVAALDYYIDYFKIDYPLPKLDMIAIPDFVSGAMENWGLITFRETSVLITEGSSSYNDFVQVTITVCHELAHMWFGDIVTMSWWDDLWLNEGFATFMAAKCGQKLKPEYNPMLKELIRSVHPVLVRDSAVTSHPIIQKVSHPDQITEIFDVISYDKGAAVLKMLEDLSPSSFREALTAYLKHYKYGNAKTEDLWSSIQDVMVNMDVSGVMGTWTKQAGYPVVNITRKGNSLILTQERFLAQKGTPYNPDDSPYKFKWDIPIVYFTSNDPRRIENQLFHKDQDNVVIKLPPNTDWYKMNWKQVGFYRVNYPRECWLELINLLKQNPDTLAWVEDKANLLEDAFQLAKAGYLSYDIPLSLVGYLQNSRENHFIPWTVAAKNLGELKKILQNTRLKDSYISFARSIVESSISDSTWELSSKTPLPEMLRKVGQLKLALDLELPSAVEKARELLQEWLDGDTDKPYTEIRTLIYNYGISGDKEKAKWDKMWQLYLDETNPQELSKLRTALGYAKDPQLLKRFLELAKNETYVRSQDYLLLLILVSFQPEGNTVIWDFVRDEWDYLVGRFSLNDRILGRLVPSIVRDYATEEKLNEVKSFFSKYPDAGAGASGRRNAIESIENNIKWCKDHMDEIENWLNDRAASISASN